MKAKLSAPPKLTARIRVVGTLSDTFTAHSRFCLADEWFNKKYWQLEPNSRMIGTESLSRSGNFVSEKRTRSQTLISFLTNDWADFQAHLGAVFFPPEFQDCATCLHTTRVNVNPFLPQSLPVQTLNCNLSCDWWKSALAFTNFYYTILNCLIPPTLWMSWHMEQDYNDV